MRTGRRIAPIGTALRIVTGFVFLYLAGAVEGGAWDVGWYDPIVGFVVLPAAMLVVGLLARHFAGGPVRFDGVVGHVANLAIIVVLVLNPYTAGGAALFYGATLLVAAWRGQRGCESTVISNLILRRDDQIGCPVFLPIDELEARWKGSGAERPRATTRDAR